MDVAGESSVSIALQIDDYFYDSTYIIFFNIICFNYIEFNNVE
jgi:hypothetical protein